MWTAVRVPLDGAAYVGLLQRARRKSDDLLQRAVCNRRRGGSGLD
jgi:hypothetical protein